MTEKNETSSLVSLRDIESHVLDASSAADPDQIFATYARIGFAKEMLKKIEAMWKDKVMEYIREHGEFRIGESLYTIGRGKKVKPRIKPAEILAVLIEKFGGDINGVGDCLSSDPFKPGSTKNALNAAGAADEFDKLFKTTWDEKIDVQIINTAFLPKAQTPAEPEKETP